MYNTQRIMLNEEMKKEFKTEFDQINIRLHQICNIVGGPTLWKENLERGPRDFSLDDRQ